MRGFMGKDFFIEILMLILAVIQLKVSLKQLRISEKIAESVTKDPYKKIINHMKLADDAKSTLKLLKIKYPDIDFGVKFYE